MSQVTLEMSGDEQRLWRSMQRVIAKQNEMESGFKQTGTAARRAGKDADDAFGQKMVSNLKGIAGGLVSIGGAVGAVTQSYAVWLQNMREISREAKKATQESLAFLALQEGGTKADRMREVAAVAAKHAITDRGAAFEAVQGLQSSTGSYESGLDAARVVFRATQVGIPIELATELAMQGQTQVQDPGAFLRQAFVAGQASGRDPETIAKAARGLFFWEDKDLGFAAAAALSETAGSEIETWVRNAGKALQSTSGLRDTFAGLGVLDGATQMDRLRALKTAGLDTTEELALAGLGSAEQQAALALLVQRLDDVQRIERRVEAKAVPGLFTAMRGGIEAEVPEQRMAREIDTIKAMSKDEQAFGQLAMQAMGEDREQLLRGLALRRLGKESFAYMFDAVDEEMRTSDLRMLALDLENMMLTNPRVTRQHVEREMQKIEAELQAAQQMGEPTESTTDDFGGEGAAGAMERAAAAQERAAQKLEHAADRMSSGSGSGGGGPLGAFPSQDE